MIAAVGATIAAYEYIRQETKKVLPQTTTEKALTTRTPSSVAKKRGSGFGSFFSALWDKAKAVVTLALGVAGIGVAIYGGLSIARTVLQVASGGVTALGAKIMKKKVTTAAIAA